MTPDERIEAYQGAYFDANGKAIGVSYSAGWYRVGYPPSKYRASEIDAFTAELRRRAASAIEARRAATVKQGAVHESAGPQDDAQ